MRRDVWVESIAPHPGTPTRRAASCYAMAHALTALEESIGRSLKSAGHSILTGVGNFLNARKVLREAARASIG